MPIYKANGKKDGLQKYTVRVNYTNNDGQAKQLTRIAYGSEAAKDLERELEKSVRDRETQLIKKMTVQELHDEYVSVRKHEQRETTIDKFKRNMSYYILPTFKDVYIDKMTVTKMKDWKLLIEEHTYLKKDVVTRLSLNSKKQMYSDFRALFSYAIEMEYIPKGQNPVTKVKTFKDTISLPSKMDFYTAQEFLLFITAAKQRAIDWEQKNNSISEWGFYIFFNIAFYMGLRKGEIHALRFTDINGSILDITRSINQRMKTGDIETPPKNKASIRALQIPKPLMIIINEHIKRLKKSGLFNENSRICGGERPLRDSSIQRRNVLYSKMAGLRVIRVHDFRHSHVSVLANENINIQEIARRLGHSRIEITWNTYSHLYPREEERAINVLNTIAA